jgi:hypothetical protein
MAEQKFIDGLKAFKPKQEFIKCELVITLNDLVKFCKDHPEYLTEYNGQKQIKVQVKESKNGTWYCALNEYDKAKVNQQVKDVAGDSLPF